MNRDTRPLVVIGDALLDIDLRGSVRRRCPDSPAPVLDAAKPVHRPGGAALAAWLAAQGDRPVVLVTALGADEAGARLDELLRDTVSLVRLPLRGRTPTKTRLLGDGRTLVRVDDGEGRADSGPPVERLAALLGSAAGVLVSDYGRGVAAVPEVREALAAAAESVPMVWDPHPRGAAPVHGMALVTPNASEAEVPEDDPRRALRRARALVRQWRAAAVAVTLGRCGVAWTAADAEHGEHLAAPRIEAPGDTCGAGDRFAAAVLEALAAGAATGSAVAGAVRAASRFVAEGGAGAAAERGPAGATLPLGLADGPAELAERVRAAGGTVVAAGGCFDVLHAGHVSLLRRARALGDCLLVCVNSDAAIRRLKGPDRPIMAQEDRIRVLSALDCVDAVAVFDEPTPAEILGRLRPDVWVKGGDYAVDDLPEAPVVAGYGGEVVLLPLLPGRSTTRLVAEMRAASD
ncbi:D-glycero-beta-D-manno-heptose 1-phosphate adenylyltransferase [Marinitenerispora sediminis]|uniref:D-glycero-beta-D-manno-heptose 1-phosphate adenylyltransferase n=1 Tax=Marinitenerispora sediminis TaxID=1931232 RepID=A0A368T2L1_9ACTN|nr:D-glycero-beta-D-manno-heptose 1-phosphate adenylyltransferase [Marinitenerispora sediminis]RCV47853.1 D-glycero-beta-D-manno-heptose 1-phosphate adenylyltransferase [Marinitenerispora sediminis]RCV48900.1 D-glycero-beta-D-manno-heptose 1-phosphate adenylyltransferase [Marinitenerispora sediminis]RCV50450.1 D-glycero-beta-D-manno-heptose 1-phosphate adenylyltransferase [Marinitenerispora sediminis]